MHARLGLDNPLAIKTHSQLHDTQPHPAPPHECAPTPAHAAPGTPGPSGCDLLVVEWEAYQAGVLSARAGLLGRSAHFLAGLPQQRLLRLAELCLCLTVGSGTVLARQGGALDALVVVQTGGVALLHEPPPARAKAMSLRPVEGQLFSAARGGGRSTPVPLLAMLNPAALPTAQQAADSGGLAGASAEATYLVSFPALPLASLGPAETFGEGILGGGADVASQQQGKPAAAAAAGAGAGSSLEDAAGDAAGSAVAGAQPGGDGTCPTWPATVVAEQPSVLLIIQRSVLWMHEFDFVRQKLQHFAQSRSAWMQERLEAAYQDALTGGGGDGGVQTAPGGGGQSLSAPSSPSLPQPPEGARPALSLFKRSVIAAGAIAAMQRAAFGTAAAAAAQTPQLASGPSDAAAAPAPAPPPPQPPQPPQPVPPTVAALISTSHLSVSTSMARNNKWDFLDVPTDGQSSAPDSPGAGVHRGVVAAASSSPKCHVAGQVQPTFAPDAGGGAGSAPALSGGVARSSIIHRSSPRCGSALRASVSSMHEALAAQQSSPMFSLPDSPSLGSLGSSVCVAGPTAAAAAVAAYPEGGGGGGSSRPPSQAVGGLLTLSGLPLLASNNSPVASPRHRPAHVGLLRSSMAGGSLFAGYDSGGGSGPGSPAATRSPGAGALAPSGRRSFNGGPASLLDRTSAGAGSTTLLNHRTSFCGGGSGGGDGAVPGQHGRGSAPTSPLVSTPSVVALGNTRGSNDGTWALPIPGPVSGGGGIGVPGLGLPSSAGGSGAYARDGVGSRSGNRSLRSSYNGGASGRFATVGVHSRADGASGSGSGAATTAASSGSGGFACFSEAMRGSQHHLARRGSMSGLGAGGLEAGASSPSSEAVSAAARTLVPQNASGRFMVREGTPTSTNRPPGARRITNCF